MLEMLLWLGVGMLIVISVFVLMISISWLLELFERMPTQVATFLQFMLISGLVGFIAWLMYETKDIPFKV